MCWATFLCLLASNKKSQSAKLCCGIVQKTNKTLAVWLSHWKAIAQVWCCGEVWNQQRERLCSGGLPLSLMCGMCFVFLLRMSYTFSVSDCALELEVESFSDVFSGSAKLRTVSEGYIAFCYQNQWGFLWDTVHINVVLSYALWLDASMLYVKVSWMKVYDWEGWWGCRQCTGKMTGIP